MHNGENVEIQAVFGIITGDSKEMTSVRDQVYQDKLAQYQAELGEITELRHPELLKGMEQLKRKLKDRLEANDIIKTIRTERVECEYDRSLWLAGREQEEKKSELMEVLVGELEEKRKQIEHDHQNTDLHGDLLEIKPMTKRNLRRRPNELTPNGGTSGRTVASIKTAPPLQFRLCDSDIHEDLVALGAVVAAPVLTSDGSTNGGGGGSSAASSVATASSGGERAVISVGDTEATMDGCRLIYDGRQYLRGQSITVEAADVGRVTAAIQAISNNELILKSVGDHKRITVSLSDLQFGRVVIKKRST